MNAPHECLPAAATRLFATIPEDVGMKGGYWNIDSDSPLIISHTLNGQEIRISNTWWWEGGGGAASSSQTAVSFFVLSEWKLGLFNKHTLPFNSGTISFSGTWRFMCCHCHFRLPWTSAPALKRRAEIVRMFRLKCQSRCQRDSQRGGQGGSEGTGAPSDGFRSRRPCGDRHSTLWPCTELTRPDAPTRLLNMCESALQWAQLL